jgi:hypothetical protein
VIAKTTLSLLLAVTKSLEELGVSTVEEDTLLMSSYKMENYTFLTPWVTVLT